MYVRSAVGDALSHTLSDSHTHLLNSMNPQLSLEHGAVRGKEHGGRHRSKSGSGSRGARAQEEPHTSKAPAPRNEQ